MELSVSHLTSQSKRTKGKLYPGTKWRSGGRVTILPSDVELKCFLLTSSKHRVLILFHFQIYMWQKQLVVRNKTPKLINPIQYYGNNQKINKSTGNLSSQNWRIRTGWQSQQPPGCSLQVFDQAPDCITNALHADKAGTVYLRKKHIVTSQHSFPLLEL